MCKMKELFHFCHGVIAALVITGFIFGCQYPSKWHHQPVSYSVLELLQVAVVTGIFVSMWSVLAAHLFSMLGTVWCGLESA